VTNTPRYPNQINFKVVSPDVCLFFHDSGYKVLQGSTICAIAPLINGKNSVNAISKKLNGALTPFDVECLLLILEDEGLLEDSSDRYPRQLDGFSDLLNILTLAFQKEIKNAKVEVQSFGVSDKRFRTLLKHLGINVAENGDLAIVLVDDYLRPELKAFNEKATRKKLRWMPIKPTGTLLWFGPVFNGGAPPCWECLAWRLSENLRAQTFSARKNFFVPKAQRPDRGAFYLAASEALQSLVASKTEPLQIHTLDLNQMNLEQHSVLRSNQCGVCSKENQNDLSKITLRNRKPSRADETFQKYKHLISPITGIVDELTTESRGPFYFSTVKHPFVLPSDKKYPSTLRLKRTSIGKGLTPLQSETAALCEALERYSGIFRGDESRIMASYMEIKEDAIHPKVSLNFSDVQYANRTKFNQQNSDFDWIPIPFDEHKQIEWSPVWSLTSNKMRYLPTAYCYYGYPLPSKERFCRADSNGNASGSTLEEAILHGFLEIVERDAVALWWFNKISRPALNLKALPLPYISALVQHYRFLSRRIYVFDITTDFEIPVFAAVSVRDNGSGFHFGFAANLDSLEAITKALLEMNQFLGTKGKDYEEAKFLQTDTVKNLDNPRKQKSTNLLDDIKTCVKLAQEREMETLVLNQTRSDIGLPVVKVIVPGMRQFWARFGKGRLYDIPKKMGWLKFPLAEGELNPNRL
jgi:ribosomal protein S12 methylthiotransferase accessory factor